MNEKETKKGSSRILKFRAWDKKENKMIPSVGLLPFQCVIIPDGETKIGDMGAYKKLYIYKEPKGFEVMQFTGLLDKNGKEIYCGDILKWDGEIDLGNLLVRWDEKRCAYSFGDTLLPVDMQNCEIIGDIYSHPKLLTK